MQYELLSISYNMKSLMTAIPDFDLMTILTFYSLPIVFYVNDPIVLIIDLFYF